MTSVYLEMFQELSLFYENPPKFNQYFFLCGTFWGSLHHLLFYEIIPASLRLFFVCLFF